jgi:hypothetical protein
MVLPTAELHVSNQPRSEVIQAGIDQVWNRRRIARTGQAMALATGPRPGEPLQIDIFDASIRPLVRAPIAARRCGPSRRRDALEMRQFAGVTRQPYPIFWTHSVTPRRTAIAPRVVKVPHCRTKQQWLFCLHGTVCDHRLNQQASAEK